jgi:endonuclease-3
MPRESKADRITRARRIARRLKKLYPARCALTHDNPFQLLVATILSAQCTDERVNAVTPDLFARYRSAADFAHAAQSDVEKLIHSAGFFRAKARNIIGTAQGVVAEYGGEVPKTLEELITLPGVGRKTANVVLGTAFGKAEGVVVDTHVGRLSRRMRLTGHDDPVKVERDLMALLPQTGWIEFSHRMIWHGRALCDARKPLCGECPLVPDCPGAKDYLPIDGRSGSGKRSNASTK